MENTKSMTYYKSLNAAIMTVTPDMASDWLTHNHTNRKLDKNLVAKYAGDMSAGNFTLNPDAIAFDADGNLTNGQHRLHAIVMSGVSTACVVIFDFPVTRSDFLNFDCGKNRTIRSRIELAGIEVKQAAVDIAGAYLYLKYKNHHNTVAGRLDFIEANADIIEWAVNTCGTSGSASTRVPAMYMVALIDAKLAGCPEEALQAFSRVYRINDFEGMENYNPKHAVELRESKIARVRSESTLNVVKSRLNAFVNKLSKCYVHDDLYPAPLLPLRPENAGKEAN